MAKWSTPVNHPLTLQRLFLLRLPQPHHRGAHLLGATMGEIQLGCLNVQMATALIQILFVMAFLIVETIVMRIEIAPLELAPLMSSSVEMEFAFLNGGTVMETMTASEAMTRLTALPRQPPPQQPPQQQLQQPRLPLPPLQLRAQSAAT